jgi:hypothetical protein
MNLNLHFLLFNKRFFCKSNIGRINSFLLVMRQVKTKLVSQFKKGALSKYIRFYILGASFYIIYEEILEILKIKKLEYFTNFFILFARQKKLFIKNLTSFFNKINFWLIYGLKIAKTWKMSHFFSLVLFNITSFRYSSLVNKKKYFHFKKNQREKGKLTKFVCTLFEYYLKDLKKNPDFFKKISLLTNLPQSGKISRFFNFSLKHLECFTNIFAFTVLAIPYIMFYSFLLDQTYIWSDLINELQVYFQKGFC